MRDGDVWIMNADGSGQNRLTVTAEQESHPFWAPSSTKIFFSRKVYSERGSLGDETADWRLFELDIASKKESLVPNLKAQQPLDGAISPDGGSIAYSGQNFKGQGLLYINELATGKDVVWQTGGFDEGGQRYSIYQYSPRWSPDGKKLAYIGGGPSGPSNILVVIDMASKNIVKKIPIAEQYANYGVLALDWLTDSQIVYETAEGGTYSDLMLYDINFGTKLSMVEGGHSYNHGPARSATHKQIAYSSRGAGGEYGDEIRVIDASGQNMRTIATNASQPAWQPVYLPAPEMTYPNSRLRTEANALTVRGKLDADTDMQRNGYFVTFFRNGKLIESNGQPLKATVNGNSFEKRLPLVYGDNKISVALNWEGVTGVPSAQKLVRRPSRKAAAFGSAYSRPEKPEDIDTTGDANSAQGSLSSAGFAATAYLNSSVAEAVSSLGSNSVFYFSGHGNWDIISFVDKQGRRTALLTDIVRQGNYGADAYERVSITDSADFSAVDLAFFNSCYPGKDIDTPGNIMKALVDNGARTAIGFKTTIRTVDGTQWSRKFWNYATSERLEVARSAYKAAQDIADTSIFSFTGDGITPVNLVVRRKNTNEIVYVYSAPPVVSFPGPIR